MDRAAAAFAAEYHMSIGLPTLPSLPFVGTLDAWISSSVPLMPTTYGSHSICTQRSCGQRLVGSHPTDSGAALPGTNGRPFCRRRCSAPPRIVQRGAAVRSGTIGIDRTGGERNKRESCGFSGNRWFGSSPGRTRTYLLRFALVLQLRYFCSDSPIKPVNPRLI